MADSRTLFDVTKPLARLADEVIRVPARWARWAFLHVLYRKAATVFELRELAVAASRVGVPALADDGKRVAGGLLLVASDQRPATSHDPEGGTPTGQTMSQSPAACLPEGYSFREAVPEDLPACARMAGWPVELYRQWWHQGEQCYVTLWQGQPINLNWLHFGSCYVNGLGLLIEAGPEQCYLYNVFTDPAHRGRGIYKCTQLLLVNLLAARGVTRVLQAVFHGNSVPHATLPKLGYVATQTVRHTRLCGLKITTITGATGGRVAWRCFWKPPLSVHRI